MSNLTLTVNGEHHALTTDEVTPLLFVLRNTLGLTAAKLGCGLEQCGACAVLVDGKKTLTCSRPAAEFEGRSIVTAEGLDRESSTKRIVDAMVGNGAAQCGYCIPGITVALAGLLELNADPDDAQIRAALRGHLCRCGSHMRVLRAARAVAGGAP
ncbi:MAG: 2Fe-2S iron-sulfur cluster binding domain-containing protein [Chromatiales bacterium]|jgi:nicotinate dehydrogenase subunit A|nr:2Fe-2S iron-sulfur cluster binding domain-containing protein [Chromatiales bacterium]